MLLGVETTPLRWFHTWRVTQTSSAPQVATTVLTTLLITIGNASHDPARVHRKATIACISVTAMISTARTEAVRTGSGILRRRAGSSTHNGRYADHSGAAPPSAAPARLLAVAALPPEPAETSC